MNRSRGRLDEFFEPLVGTEQARQKLVDDLASRVHGAVDIDEAYDALQDGFLEATGGSGQLGAKLAVAGLRRVGSLYAAYATLPQRFPNVQQSAMGTVHYIYRQAFADNGTSTLNAVALNKGVDPRGLARNPRDLAVQNTIAKMAQANYFNLSPSAFEVEVSDDGQLIILPKHALLRGMAGRRCPAVHARVPGPEHQRPALLTLLNTLGSVAVAEIFPREFETDYAA